MRVTIVEKILKRLFYYTIGTGIGAGVIQRGEFIGGTSHPEMGHVYVSKHPIDVANNFDGVCPFHKGCLEGLAAGPSFRSTYWSAWGTYRYR